MRRGWTKPGAGGALAMDQAIDASPRAVLLDVKRFAGGLPGDRLTPSGASGEVVLAQPAANPTFCAGC